MLRGEPDLGEERDLVPVSPPVPSPRKGRIWSAEDSRYSRALEGRTVAEAAGFLGIPLAALKAWIRGWRARGVRP